MITCFFEDHNQAQLRHVTVNALVLKDNQILLGKRGTYMGKPILESGKWSLLGGFLGRDENLVQAVKREVKEESGWEISNIQLLRINDNPNRPKEDRQNVDVIFTAHALHQAGKPDEEVLSLQWFDILSLPSVSEFAFDHLHNIEIYLHHLKSKTNLPILG